MSGRILARNSPNYGRVARHAVDCVYHLVNAIPKNKGRATGYFVDTEDLEWLYKDNRLSRVRNTMAECVGDSSLTAAQIVNQAKLNDHVCYRLQKEDEVMLHYAINTIRRYWSTQNKRDAGLMWLSKASNRDLVETVLDAMASICEPTLVVLDMLTNKEKKNV